MKKTTVTVMSLMLVALLIGIVGCNATDKVGEILQKTYTVLIETDAVLTEVEGLIAGSELADKLGPQLATAKMAIGTVKSTLETIAALLSQELNTEILVVAADAETSAVERLSAAITELEGVNAKYREELD